MVIRISASHPCQCGRTTLHLVIIRNVPLPQVILMKRGLSKSSLKQGVAIPTLLTPMNEFMLLLDTRVTSLSNVVVLCCQRPENVRFATNTLLRKLLVVLRSSIQGLQFILLEPLSNITNPLYIIRSGNNTGCKL